MRIWLWSALGICPECRQMILVIWEMRWKAPAALERCKGPSSTWQSEPTHYKFKGSHWGQTSWKHVWVAQRFLKENECHKIAHILSMVLSLRVFFFLQGLLGNDQGNFSFPCSRVPWEGPTNPARWAMSGRAWKRTGSIYNTNDLPACHEALLLLLCCRA